MTDTAGREASRLRLLEEVFGPGPSSSPRDRARESSRIFVRGLDLLTFDESPKATGRRLTALEAFDAYGMRKLYDVIIDGSAIISANADAAGRVLGERRRQLGLPIRTVASKSGLTPEIVEALEQSSRRPIREYERVGRLLGLDERKISFQTVAEENERLAVRLRTLADEQPSLSASSVANLAEAAWVAMTQIRLEGELGLEEKNILDQDADYGYPGRPPFMVGYELADRFREALGLGSDPIPSMRALIETRLGIPVVQAQLDKRIAGATIESDGRRAIVLNIDGLNGDALVRRSTMAHEIAHLVFDPSQRLEDLRVDEYRELEARPDQRADPVEQRANAFAVQLLAPQDSALERYSRTRDLFAEVLDYFGVSFTAGRYQVWNGLERAIPLDEIRAPNRHPEADWDARESFTLTYHPIRSVARTPSRAGRFSAVVIGAAHEGLVTWDTASAWLGCSEDEAKDAVEEMKGLFDEVFVDETSHGAQ